MNPVDNPVGMPRNGTNAHDSQPERRRDQKYVVVLARHLSNSTPQPLSRAIAAYRKLDLSNPCRHRTTRGERKRALRLNVSQVARLVDRYNAGATVYELANQFYIDRKTVSMHLRRQGVVSRYQPPSTELVDEMIRLYESGLSLVRVGERIGVDPATVQRHLGARGVVRRDPHGRPRAQDQQGSIRSPFDVERSFGAGPQGG